MSKEVTSIKDWSRKTNMDFNYPTFSQSWSITHGHLKELFSQTKGMSQDEREEYLYSLKDYLYNVLTRAQHAECFPAATAVRSTLYAIRIMLTDPHEEMMF